MTFQSNIPLAGDLISVSQQDLNNNFTAIGTAFPVNHVNFNAAGAGKHKFVEMPNQSPAPVGAGAQSTLFSQLSPAPASQSELYFLRNNTTPIQMTVGSPTAASKGSTFLPGGIIMQWGSSGTSGAAQTFFAPFPNNVFAVTAGILDTTGTRTVTFTIQGTTGVTLFFPGAVTVYYIAIGN